MTRRILAFLLLAAGVGGAGAAVGVFAPEPGSDVLPAAFVSEPGADPGIPLAWSSEAIAPSGLQALGLERAAEILRSLALALLAVGVGSAALLLAMEVSAGRRERAVRGLVGASPVRLAGRGLLEALAIGAAGAGAGAAIALGGASLLLERWPGRVLGSAPEPWLPAAAAGAAAIVVCLAAFAPVLRVFRAGWLGDALAPGARTNPGASRERVRALVIAGQTLLAVTILYAGALLALPAMSSGSTVSGSTSSDPTYDLAVLEVDAGSLSVDERRERYRALEEAVRAVPGVVAAGLGSRGALGGRGTLESVLAPVQGPAGTIADLVGTRAEHHAVTPQWLDTVGVEPQGRSPGEGAVVVDPTFARFVGWGGPETDGPRPVLVGGAGGVPVEAVGLLPRALPLAAPGWGRLFRALPFDMTSRSPPVVYLSFDEYPPKRAEILVRRAPALRGGSSIDADLRVAVAGVGLGAGRIESVGERLGRMAAPGRRLARLVGALAAAGLAVAVLGVGGMFQGAVEGRIAELGLRRAVGGGRVRIVAGLLGELALPMAIAAWFGVAMAVAAGQAVTDLLPEAPALDVRLYAASLAVVAVAALLGATGPAIRAAFVPPAQAIRLGEETAGGDLV